VVFGFAIDEGGGGLLALILNVKGHSQIKENKITKETETAFSFFGFQPLMTY